MSPQALHHAAQGLCPGVIPRGAQGADPLVKLLFMLGGSPPKISCIGLAFYVY